MPPLPPPPTASVHQPSHSPTTKRRKRREVDRTAGKRFVCQNEGCARSFTRAEHLQRHVLNHSSGEWTCERCRAHFKRRDLLGEWDVVVCG